MEQIIREAMNQDIIDKAAILYDVKSINIKYVGGFENFVYEYTKNSKEYILRFVHNHHRSFDLVFGELEFIDYLSKNNAKVSTVVHSINDNIVEKIDINDKYYFTVCVFTKAPGERVQKQDLTDEFYKNFGFEVGRLHKLTKSYKPKHKRHNWYDELYFKNPAKFLPEKDTKIVEIYFDLLNKIKKMPKNIDNHGLIHTDLHFGNMYYSSGKLTFFDWDDASYKHFISDIAIIIFYHFSFGDFENDYINRESARILTNFMIGYRQQNSLNIDEFKKLNDFLLLRTIALYIVLNAADDVYKQNEHVKKFLLTNREKIINKTPYLDLDIVLNGIY